MRSKVVARGALIERGLSIRKLLPYVWSYPVATAIVGVSDLSVIEANVRVAKEFKPLGRQEISEVQKAARRSAR